MNSNWIAHFGRIIYYLVLFIINIESYIEGGARRPPRKRNVKKERQKIKMSKGVKPYSLYILASNHGYGPILRASLRPPRIKIFPILLYNMEDQRIYLFIECLFVQNGFVKRFL